MTTATTLTLTDFLLARIAEDEAAARALEPDGERLPYGDPQFQPTPFDRLGDDLLGYLGGPLGEHAARWHPARVLAECEAKRRLAAEHGPLRSPFDQVTYCRMCVSPYGFAAKNSTMATGTTAAGQAFPCSTLRLLAVPYADHPDYREEWRP